MIDGIPMSEKMAIDPQTQFGNETQNGTAISHDHRKRSLLGKLLYIASIAVVAVFVWNVHQVDDLPVLRENLRNDLVVGDIKHIVQMVLGDIGLMERTRLDNESNTELSLPDDRSIGNDGLSGENGKSDGRRGSLSFRSHTWCVDFADIYLHDSSITITGDLYKLHKRRKRNSKRTRWIIRKSKKRRNGRPLRLW